MDLRQSLASSFAARYPREAAAALETRAADEIAQVLRMLSPKSAASVLHRIAPGTAARAIDRLDTDTTAGILAELDTDDALSLLRRLSPDLRETIIGAMPAEQANALKTAIRFPADTAGALMDPRVVALPGDLTVEEAFKAVRREAEHAHYDLYVVDRERRLIGVLTLRELMLARPKDLLETIMQPARHRLSPSAGRYAIAAHPGWREVYSIPVVDRNGRFMGALSYPVLGAIEDELKQTDTVSGETAARALGELFWTGVGGVIDALTAAVAPTRRRDAPGTTTSPTGTRRSNGVNDGQERESDRKE